MLNSIQCVRLRRGATLAAAMTIAALAATIGSSDVAVAAGGQHTQTYTDNYHGTQTLAEPNPCTGSVIVGTFDTNSVFHVTYFVDSDETWLTSTEEDRFSGVDQSTGVAYTGHDTFWGNYNLNRQNSNDTFTGSIHAIGSDGTAITYHEVAHITMLPDGNVAVSFDKPSVSCG